MHFFLNSITFFLFFIIIIIIFSDASFSDPDYRFSNCSNTFDCGLIKSIGYPFWGVNRPDYCGHPGYLLDCQNNVTQIQIMSMAYQVLNINQQTKILTIARKDFMDKPCPSSYKSTTLDPTLFNYTPNTSNLTLFYGCPVRSAAVDVNHRFTCENVYDSNAYYYVNSPWNHDDCTWRLAEPISQTAGVRLESGQSTLTDVLRGGFEVEVVVNDTVCAQCGASGGVCGYDKDLQRGSCFCVDGPRRGRCASSPRPAPAPAPAPVVNAGVNKRRKVIKGRKVIIAASIAGTLMVVMAVAILCYLRRKTTKYPNLCCLRRKKRTMDAQKLTELLRDHKLLATKIYKYSDVKKMTNSFQDKLGQGGYGSVFKGQLPDGRMVAVKVLSETKGNGEEFINEVASISRTSHVNVVPLLGFCIEGRKKALVYEFMPNGSLEKFIFIKSEESAEAHSQLGWEALYKIAVGIAQGLEYLHRGCLTRIVHFDIKPHNILLDQDFCPKISDFGLAKLCFKKDSIMSVMGTRGTIGYIAPELVSRNFGGVSHKSDVYSYGMMVLEMVGGRKNVDVWVDNPSEIYFPHWIYKQLDQRCGDLGLYRAVTADDQEIARKMTIVGLWCMQTEPPNRPSMNEVLDMLEGSVEDLRIPPKPYLSSPTRPKEGPGPSTTSTLSSPTRPKEGPGPSATSTS